MDSRNGQGEFDWLFCQYEDLVLDFVLVFLGLYFTSELPRFV